jgi:hypothetical protein
MSARPLGGYDPLDARLDEGAVAPAGLPGRAGLPGLAGWSASSVPVATLLLVGLGLGPAGMSLLSPGALSLLDPAVPVALAAIGTLAGVGVDVRHAASWRPWVGAILGSGLAAVLVALGLVLLSFAVPPTLSVPTWIAASTLGLCAATSLVIPGGHLVDAASLRARVTQLDVLLPITLGGFVLGLVQAGAVPAAIAVLGQSAGIAVLLGAAGWLLLARTASDTEQRVFAFGTMLLIGGAAGALGLSPLFSGLLAGLLWQAAGGEPLQSLRRDALYVQHSLLVLVLIVAGARADVSSVSLAIAVAYVIIRTAAKPLAVWAAARVVGWDARTSRADLWSPGVFGVGLAVTLERAAGPAWNALLGIVVLGTIGSEIVAELVRRRRPALIDGEQRRVTP